MPSGDVGVVVITLLAATLLIAALAVLVLAASIRSYERVYRLVQALLVGLLSEMPSEIAGVALGRVVVEQNNPDSAETLGTDVAGNGRPTDEHDPK